jgi:hypothetical protein
MSASPPPGLFKPAHQGHSLAILVLIENSAAMIDRWPDLRDRYLPTLLGTVRKVNPVVPVRVNTSLRSPRPTGRPYLSNPRYSLHADSGYLSPQLPRLCDGRGYPPFK